MQDFLSLGISETLQAKLHDYGVDTPTPIQQQSIPSVLASRDIIAQAQTGTGKTFAFILPILEKINPNAEHIQALIVTPTRELALQITSEVEKLVQDIEGIDVLAVYGGQDVEKQLRKLKRNIGIVVGTPGRLLDHIRRGTIDLSQLSSLVLDEADQMLHIGFLHEVEDIIRETPSSRQTMLFSATIPTEVRKLAKNHMHEPQYIQVEKTQGPADNVEQLAIHMTDREKQTTLIQLVEEERPFLAVIFCRTKRRVSKLYGVLKSNGFLCDELHGDLSQAKREKAMKRFRDAKTQLLIATDVAARGLDVEGITHVFNYDIPLDSESFVHRIGRTGRAGTTGKAITFYSSDDRPLLAAIEKELNISIQKQNLGNGIEDSKKDNPNQKNIRSKEHGKEKKSSSTPKRNQSNTKERKQERKSPMSKDSRSKRRTSKDEERSNRKPFKSKRRTSNSSNTTSTSTASKLGRTRREK
ncbi:DEAD/DEAH box helicase [Bacillus seohaeanensis]|uniref:DEAD/DEAH box helicase n=1 Tax=Bacillus seohaeanensis TaxID=284580 RepID=A0ABW5RUT9_9BACI